MKILLVLLAIGMLAGCVTVSGISDLLTTPKPVCSQASDVGGRNDAGKFCTRMSDGSFEWK